MVLRDYNINDTEIGMSGYMRFYLSGVRGLSKKDSLTHIEVRAIMEARDKYTHYGDVAIKYGEDVSRLPRRIRVERDIAEVISRLEQGDRRIAELKLKFNKK